jgi:hypothetical protein
VPIVFAQRRKAPREWCGCGRSPSKQTPRPWWRDAAGMQRRGGDDAYDIKLKASWVHAASGATHIGTKQRPPQLQKVGAAGCNVGGRDQIVRRAKAAAARRVDRERESTLNAQHLTSKWRSRNMAREGRNTATDYLEGWDPTLTCWQLLRRITEGLASNTMSLSLLLDRARPMTWCDVDPMAVTPICSRPARREPTCAGFSPAKLRAHHTRSMAERQECNGETKQECNREIQPTRNATRNTQRKDKRRRGQEKKGKGKGKVERSPKGVKVERGNEKGSSPARSKTTQVSTLRSVSHVVDPTGG